MQNVLNFVVAHQTVLAGVMVAILDLVFAVVPSWQSSGLLHFVFVQFQKLATKPAEDAPKA